MRIGIDAKVLSHKGGICRYLKNILDVLQQIDKENEYVLFEDGYSNYKITNPRWKSFNILFFRPVIVYVVFLIPFIAKIFRLDVFWAPEGLAPFYLPGKIKYVLTVHDLTYLHYPETMEARLKLYYKFLMPKAIKRADLILTVSDFIKTDILNNIILDNKNKVKKVSLGVKLRRKENYKKYPRKDNLLFVGSLEPRKNIINAVKALEILKKKFNLSIKLVIAGPPGWNNNIIKDYLFNSCVKENIKLLGYIDDKELQVQYSQCKAFIFPSLYEGFGLPVLEALSEGCMVLTSEKSPMQEILGKSALYFNPKDPESIACIVKRIYEKDFRQEKYMMMAPEILKRYSWEKTADLTLQYLKSLD